MFKLIRSHAYPSAADIFDTATENVPTPAEGMLYTTLRNR